MVAVARKPMNGDCIELLLPQHSYDCRFFLSANMKEYFSHDYNTRSDPKVLKMLRKWGMSGYGVFWAIVELLYQNDNNYPCDYEAIAYDLHENENIVKSIIEDYELFEVSDGVFCSNSIGKRLDKRKDISRKRAESIKKRWSKNEEQKEGESEQKPTETYNSNTNVIQLNNETDTIVSNFDTKRYKEKKRKEKEIIDSNNTTKEISLSDNNTLLQEKPSIVSLKNFQDFSDDSKGFALWFKQSLPDSQKVNETDLKNWAMTYDEMIRLDGRTPEQIKAVVQWAREDDFWRRNFISAKKLRLKDKSGVQYFDVFDNAMRASVARNAMNNRRQWNEHEANNLKSNLEQAKRKALDGLRSNP